MRNEKKTKDKKEDLGKRIDKDPFLKRFMKRVHTGKCIPYMKGNKYQYDFLLSGNLINSYVGHKIAHCNTEASDQLFDIILQKARDRGDIPGNNGNGNGGNNGNGNN